MVEERKRGPTGRLRQERSEGSCILTYVIPSLRSIGHKYRHRRIPSAMELDHDQHCRAQPELDVTIGKLGNGRGAFTKHEEVAKKSRPSAKRTHEQVDTGALYCVFMNKFGRHPSLEHSYLVRFPSKMDRPLTDILISPYYSSPEPGGWF